MVLFGGRSVQEELCNATYALDLGMVGWLAGYYRMGTSGDWCTSVEELYLLHPPTTCTHQIGNVQDPGLGLG